MWDEGLNSVVLPTLSTMILFVFTINFFRYLMNTSHIQIRDATKEHNWKTITGTSKVLARISRTVQTVPSPSRSVDEAKLRHRSLHMYAGILL